ncbi:type II secretion system protein F [Candidatus Tenderia electrophaga]|jgi:type IV pilus assembly protein PilC|uniref:Type II secretion system protein F n=1 Tax=Candidatus Tenderia electrophaga TaxID=1748243 RepID=A0A0S2T9K8_9GAMM|nr:type II secretion system protein F [Candidatus Tenderia electrophaga]
MAEKTASLDTFIWEGTDKRGNRAKGEIRGNSPTLVKAELRRQGVNPLKVKKKPKPLFGGAAKKKKITAKDIAVFSRQMATMMSSGVPLVQAFEIVGRGHENPAMQEMLMRIKTDIEGGASLAEALAKYPNQFDGLYCNLVNAGEQAGILESLLHKIAIYKEKIEAIKGKIKKALFYPAAVIVAAIIVTGILLYFVVPQFAALFKGFGADLPAMTQIVIDMSNFMVESWYIVVGGIAAIVYAFTQAKKKSQKFRDFLDRFALKAPIFGEIIRKATIARFARTLSTMFAAGVPLVEAMTTVAGAAGNVVYSNAILRMRDEISTGISLQQSMRQSQLFPNMVVQLVAIGEEAGSIDAMLAKIADFYEEEVDNAVDGLSSLMEPLIMAFLGVIIGGLVVAMYLPIFKMGEVV